jgi:hypothetical protein
MMAPIFFKVGAFFSMGGGNFQHDRQNDRQNFRLGSAVLLVVKFFTTFDSVGPRPKAMPQDRGEPLFSWFTAFGREKLIQKGSA